ncbi:uncharacterized protein DUF4149 [Limnobacter thiooxidans]|uniref:TMEM205-like domain-containing protein n=1 Tax=Limnobacter thiooxidans TaxID=131080 RepID=A0AA86M8Y4_9BURK|nr:DUF4149 domain-containing protein [Limnobacter sp.]MCZ8014679.1 DUF4149 domain-containing protein [Limnobacter sp.]RZS40688.1 uncharacterized protein DUF4149 [Limnobacter thiooxidans]BET26879.1 hypothetical protein RGQ30_23800 [Limnobacter thiooxidans]
MTWRGFRSAELVFWAIWLGALWFMAILVAPGLFKWLPRPEAGLVAGRLFYMLTLYSLVTSGVLLALSNFAGEFRAGLKVNILMAVILVVSVFELAWLQPHMESLRAAMAGLEGDALATLRSQFGNMHAASSVLYSIKMIGALVWGLSRFGVKPAAVSTGV